MTFPESKYRLQADADTRSVAETLAHIAGLSRWQHRLHCIDKKSSFSSEDYARYMQDAGAFENALKAKDDSS